MSAQPIPEGIETLAVRLANEEAGRAAHARSDEGRNAIVRRLRAEAKAQGMPVKEYIEALAKNPKGVTPSEGKTPTSAFWSYGIEHPNAPKNHWGQNFLDNRYIAEAWATLRKAGSAQTLETTEAGRKLNEMYLWDEEVRQALGGADKGFTQDWTRECWATLSETYAAAATGPVAVFAEYGDTRSILYTRELPTLHANENVAWTTSTSPTSPQSPGRRRPGAQSARTPHGPNCSTTTRPRRTTSTPRTMRRRTPRLE